MTVPSDPGVPAPRDAVGGVPLDRTLTYRLHRLHKLTDHASQQAYLAGAGLSLGDGRCLAAVGSFEPLSVNDLAQQANVTKGQASRAAQWLAEQGLVRKSASPVDGRGVVLTLTPQGRVAWQSIMQIIGQRNEDIFGCLTPDEQAQLSHLFDRLIERARPASVGSARPTDEG